MLSQRQHEFNELYLSFLGNNGENILLLFLLSKACPYKEIGLEKINKKRKRKEKPWNNNKKKPLEIQYSLE